eukprot:8492604-Prorocentrum_lima.AAC.1
MCVFDRQLHESTERQMGLDFCEDDFMGGVFVLEDTFEHWASPDDPSTNAMKSGLWEEVNLAQ